MAAWHLKPKITIEQLVKATTFVKPPLEAIQMSKCFEAKDDFRIISENWPIAAIEMLMVFGERDHFRKVNESWPHAVIQMSKPFAAKDHHRMVRVSRLLVAIQIPKVSVSKYHFGTENNGLIFKNFLFNFTHAMLDTSAHCIFFNKLLKFHFFPYGKVV